MHEHTFDPISGWCTGCVGYRDDGRLIHKGGSVFRPGNALQAETTTDTEETS